MKLTLVNTVMLVGLLSACQAFGQDAKLAEELKKFAGTWKLESSKEDGQDSPANEFDKIVVNFKGNKMIAWLPDENDLNVEFKLDPSSTPALFDFIGEKDGAHSTVEGIYKFENGKLILCLNTNPNGKERPAKFESPEGSTIVLQVLRRSKE